MPRSTAAAQTASPSVSKLVTASAVVVSTSSIPNATVSRVTPYDVFLLCIERAENLVKIHKSAHGSKARPEAYLSDAFRAAIVLAISALDAFIRTFVLEKLREVWSDNAKTLPVVLAEQIKELLNHSEVVEAARKDELLSKVIRAFAAQFETKSFQGVRNISQCMQLIGYDDIFHQVAIAASMNEDKLKADVGRFTKRRHMIAHQGDHDLTQNPPILNPIRKKDAEECIKLVSTVAKFINSLS